MKRRHSILLLFVASLGLACATSTRVSVDSSFDTSQYRSWSWLPHGEPRVFSPARDTPALEARIAKLIAHEMSSRGYRQVSQAPDFLLDFRLLVRRHTVIVQVPQAAIQLSSLHSSPSYVVESTRPQARVQERARLDVVLLDADGTALWKADIQRFLNGGAALQIVLDVETLLARLPAVTQD
jgi:hypothetical protein